MLARLRSRAQDEKGFTLIELLVVVLIIGILAAIAIPAFLGQKKGAQDSNAKSLLRNAAIAMESFYSENQNFGAGATVVPGTGAGSLAAIEPNLTWTTQITAAATTGTAVDAKKDALVVQGQKIPATVADFNAYTLFTRSASGNGFTYIRLDTAQTYKCKDTAATPAWDTAATCSSAANEW